MEISYSYTLVGVKKVPSLNGLDDVIISLDFIVSILADGVVKFNWNLADVPVDIPTADNFKVYDSLTEGEILAWVMDTNIVASAKDGLRRSINELFTQKEYVSWNNGPTLLEISEDQYTML